MARRSLGGRRAGPQVAEVVGLGVDRCLELAGADEEVAHAGEPLADGAVLGGLVELLGGQCLAVGGRKCIWI